MTYTMCVNATCEGATSGGRAGPRVKLNQNISYNKVTLKENNELHNSSVPSSQINNEGETILGASLEGI